MVAEVRRQLARLTIAVRRVERYEHDTHPIRHLMHSIRSQHRKCRTQV